MTFGQSIQTVFRKYADFSGRARRSEFWWFVLFSSLASGALGLIPPHLDNNGSLWSALFQLAVVIPSLAVGARRLHDTGRSGWWQLLWIVIIIGWIILIVWWASDSKSGANRYGENPESAEVAP